MDRKISIMGIVNLTDDSFYAPSRALGERAVWRTALLVEEGAELIDIGACSTRPGSEGVGAEEEWRRLSPVLEAVRKAFPQARISIDSYWSVVVQRAFELIGDFVVNDISAGEADPRMLPLVGRLGLGYIAMHMRGTPKTMQSLTDYTDVTAQVLEYFRAFDTRAAEAGLRDWILDPGFGFSKTVEQNYTLLRELGAFRTLGRPVLAGISRKSMAWKPLGITPEDALPATQVLQFKALENGADILRVHDVAEALRTVRLYQLMNPR